MATTSSKHARVTRRTVLTCALATPAVMAGSRRASASDTVSVGMVNTISDAGFFVADAKGYFKAAGSGLLRRSIRDKRPEVGWRFIKAYLQGVRDYNDALKDGRIAGPKRT